MILSYNSQILDRKGNLLDNGSVDDAIFIRFGQFDPCPPNRTERRQRQSAAVRQLLSLSLLHYFGEKRSSLWQLNKSSTGKPILNGSNPPSISLAHSDDWIACAIGNIANIGIDIEAIRPRNWGAYREDVLHEDEASWVMHADDDERDVRGLSCWCRKEALFKALGTGIDVSPSKIAFSPDGSLSELPPHLGSRSGWTSYTHALSSKAVVAVAWKN